MNPFDSLPARVKVRAMVGYLLSAAAVLWAPLLWGGASPWRHIGWLVPALAVVWFGGALVLGRGAAAELGDPHHDGAFRRLRRQLLWSVLRVATSALLVGLYALALVVGPKSVADDQRLIDQQPHRSATIVTVTQVWLGHTPSWDVDVLVDGRTSRLALEPAGVSHAKAGDAIEVVVDPADPSYVIPTSAHDDWIYSTRGTVLLDAVMGVLVLVVIASLLWGAMPPRLFRSATQIRTTHRGRVVAAGYAGLTIEVGGVLWQWTRGRRTAALPQVGGTVVLLGQVREGSLVFLDDRRTRWPGGPLMRAE